MVRAPGSPSASRARASPGLADAPGAVLLQWLGLIELRRRVSSFLCGRLTDCWSLLRSPRTSSDSCRESEVVLPSVAETMVLVERGGVGVLWYHLKRLLTRGARSHPESVSPARIVTTGSSKVNSRLTQSPQVGPANAASLHGHYTRVSDAAVRDAVVRRPSS